MTVSKHQMHLQQEALRRLTWPDYSPSPNYLSHTS